MKNWPHQILYELLDNYSETTSDLTRFAITTLKIDSKDRIKSEKIKDILDQLEKRNYIWWKVLKNHRNINTTGDKDFWLSYNDYKKNFGLLVKGVEETFDNNRVEAQLTIEGLDYALKLRREREQHESIMATNESTRFINQDTSTNYNTQRIFSWATIALAAMAAIFSALTYFKSDEIKIQDWQQLIQSQEKTKKSIDQLQQQSSAPVKSMASEDSLIEK